MRYVLLELDDEAARKFVTKAGKKVIGVWRVPKKYCICPDMYNTVADDWTHSITGLPRCKQCGGIYKPLIGVLGRLRALLGRNIVEDYRTR